MKNSRIYLMSPLLANQIAAGEVVERPASVVKELLENSIDAGATQIHIDLERSGIDRIRIRDNGVGIIKDDLTLAISRHATSKVLQASDLQAIHSLGFRGEALASIAAVAKVNLHSKTEMDEHAWSLTYDPSNGEPVIEPVSHPQGTTLEVNHLFFNVPARRKFLRSDRTELEHVETVVKQIALSRHHVQIQLKHRQSTLLNAKAASNIEQTRQRIASICGQPFVDGALAINFSDQRTRLHGWLGLPETARSQSDAQYFYVNGRIVRDKVLNHAVRMAYQGSIPEGRYPCYVLYLELPEDAVDVNVHPTKHEVRFYESRQIHDFIAFHLDRALRHGVVSEEIEENNSASFKSPELSVKESTPVYQYQSVQNNRFSNSLANKKEEIVKQANDFDLIKENPLANKATADFLASSIEEKSTSEASLINFKLLAPFKKNHLLVEIEEGLLIIAIQAAFQTCVYETLLASDNAHPLIAQPLLLPTSLTFATKQSEVLETKLPHLRRYGILLTQASEQRWLVRELPAILKNMAIEAGITAIIENKNEFEHEAFCLQFAKQIKHNDHTSLDHKAQLELIKRLLALENWQHHAFKPCQIVRV